MESDGLGLFSVATHRQRVEDKNGIAWKCGAYEPSTCIHGDIEYLYEIDLQKKTLKGWQHDGNKKGKAVPTSELAAEMVITV